MSAVHDGTVLRRPPFGGNPEVGSRGATTPIRLVSSAKSWLSHPGVDRRSALLLGLVLPLLALIGPRASTRS